MAKWTIVYSCMNKAHAQGNKVQGPRTHDSKDQQTFWGNRDGAWRDLDEA